jgi:hypothetical protein
MDSRFSANVRADRGRGAQSGPRTRADVVRVSTEKLGVLENKVTTRPAPPWSMGIADLRQLAPRSAEQLNGRKREQHKTVPTSMGNGGAAASTACPSDTSDIVAKVPAATSHECRRFAAKAAFPAWQ